MSDDKNIPGENLKEQIQNSNEESASENIQQEQTLDQTETTNPTSEIQKSEIEKMEVHHHPNLHHRKKHWKEYFLEFLMIFLAVTLGFFAESYREYLSDRSKEKEYINSMIEDLRIDSSFLELCINKLIPYHLMWMDSTVHLFEMPDLKGKDRAVYQAFYLGTAWTYNFHPTERTLSQLHTEGFNLIKNKAAVKTISDLELQYKLYLQFTTFIDDLQNKVDLSVASFADRNVVDTISTLMFKNFQNDPFVHLRLTDVPASATIKNVNPEILKACVKALNDYSFYIIEIKNSYAILLNSINKTIGILETEYYLKNE